MVDFIHPAKTPINKKEYLETVGLCPGALLQPPPQRDNEVSP
jgi:hypothetical protein